MNDTACPRAEQSTGTPSAPPPTGRIRIATHCGAWGAFRGQSPLPEVVGAIWDCIAHRAREEAAA